MAFGSSREQARLTRSHRLQQEVREVGQAVHENCCNLGRLHLQRWVGHVIDVVQQGRQPAPVAPDQAVQGVEACTH